MRLHGMSPSSELVAYFCAEYAVDQRLPIYSGGLGVLAGDHLKTASDMEVPMIAVGLLYREGYFTQRLDAHGQQHAEPMPVDPLRTGLDPVLDVLGRELRVQVPMADRNVALRVWRKDVGTVPLLLLDADVDGNLLEDRGITARLYGTGHDLRLRQEIVLGIGGVRVLRALGLQPSIWHINEGHAAFLILERMRERISHGYSFEAALEVVAACTVFTTHTPVPAGHDVFNQGQLRHWLGEFPATLHTTERRLLDLGSSGIESDANRFNMTSLALRGSRFRNAVSKVHRTVAASMEAAQWPQIPPDESPLTSVTNGVHLPTFLAERWQTLLDRHAPAWRQVPPRDHDLNFIDTMYDEELVALRGDLRRHLLEKVRRRVREQHLRAGTPGERLDGILRGLDLAEQRGLPIIGFARRFATYKRATLLLHDRARLARLLGDPERPALLLFAGKSHPNDGGGQALIRQLYQAGLQPEFLGRLIVIEGYDLALARALVQGCDVWLNTPEYPMEASGTSGMKAGVNGCVNVSVLDGWWPESYDGSNGYAIEPVMEAGATRDALEAAQLFDLLEQQVLPDFYGDGTAMPSPAWLRRVRHSVRSILPRFASTRMLGEYIEQLYRPAAELGRRTSSSEGKIATNLARWKRLTYQRWDALRVDTISTRPNLHVRLQTGGLPSHHLAVDVVTAEGAQLPLRLESARRDQADFRLEQPLEVAIRELRIYPTHPLLPHPYELGLLLRVAAPEA